MSGGRGRDASQARPKPLEIVTGIFVLAFVVGVMVFAAWRSGAFERLSRERRPAVTWFRSVGSLKEQEQVVFRGYPMGEITRISFDEKRRLIRVDMAIDPAFRLPDRAVANVTVSSMSALSAYIELTTDFTGLDTRSLIRGRLDVVVNNGVVEFDAVDPVNTGTILTQGSSYLMRGGEMMDVFFLSTESQLQTWNAALNDPGMRRSVHGGAAEARAMTAEGSAMSRSAGVAMQRGAAAARDADRWLQDHEETVAAAVARAEATTAGARAWMAEFTAHPALVKQ